MYRAIVEGVPDEPAAKLQHWLRKDERHRRVHVTMKDKDTAQEARLSYRLIRELAGDLSLLEVRLETGRKHQIRVQLSAIGHPIVGDRKYKSNVAFSEGIALHSYYVKLTHPVKREPIEVTSAEPASWRALLRP